MTGLVVTSAGRVLSELPTGRDNPLTDPRDVFDAAWYAGTLHVGHLELDVPCTAKVRHPRPIFLAPPAVDDGEQVACDHI